MTRDDPWLDAFDDADFEAAELAVIDAAVNRLAPPPLPTPEVPARSRSRWAGPVAVAAAVLVGIALGAWLRPAEPSVEPPQVVSPVQVIPPSELPVRISPAPAVLPAPAPAPVAAPVARVVAPAVVVPPASEAPAAATPPVPEAPIPELEPGLIADGDARVRIVDSTATLASGLLTYLHDATHEPGVRRVAWVDLDISAVPLGTVFRAVARPRVGAVAVSDGRVQVVHDDGTVLAVLEPGDEVAAVPDLADPRGVTLLHTDGLPLDAVRAAVPDDCLCRPADVVASIAALRLAALDDP